MRSYPGDRDSLRSGRRSRRGEDSSSGYSDNERRYRRSAYVALINVRGAKFFVIGVIISTVTGRTVVFMKALTCGLLSAETFMGSHHSCDGVLLLTAVSVPKLKGRPL